MRFEVAVPLAYLEEPEVAILTAALGQSMVVRRKLVPKEVDQRSGLMEDVQLSVIERELPRSDSKVDSEGYEQSSDSARLGLEAGKMVVQKDRSPDAAQDLLEMGLVEVDRFAS